MKINSLILAAAALIFSASQTFANPADVQPSTDTLIPATVQSVVVLQAETSNKPSIKLVKVTNGGSTDISSLMSPSRLYLGVHINGEMFDINGSYLVVDSLVSVTSATFNAQSKTISLKYVSKNNDQLKTVKKEVTILLKDVLAEIDSATSEDFVDYTIKSTVGVQERN